MGSLRRTTISPMTMLIAIATGIKTQVIVLKSRLMLSISFISHSPCWRAGRQEPGHLLRVWLSLPRHLLPEPGPAQVLHALDEEIEKIARPHTERHFHVRCVRRGLVKVREGLAHRNAAGDVHVDVMLFVIAKLGREGERQRKRVVDDAAFD